MQRRGNRRDILLGLIGNDERVARLRLQELVQVACVKRPSTERRLVEDPAEEGDSRPDAEHSILPQRPLQSRDRLRAVGPPDDQLRNQWVVVDRHFGLRFSPAVIAHPWAIGRPKGCDEAWGREEAGIRVLSIDAAFDCVPSRHQRRGRFDVQPLAIRDTKLPLHEVDAGHHLGDGMFDLETGVHFEKPERALVVEQELDSAGAYVAHRSGDGGRRRRESRAQL